MAQVTLAAFVLLGVSLGSGLWLGRRGLGALVGRIFDRRIERWLAQRDAADGPYVHLPRPTALANAENLPVRPLVATHRAPAPSLGPVAAAR